jgi:hypothetical protein
MPQWFPDQSFRMIHGGESDDERQCRTVRDLGARPVRLDTPAVVRRRFESTTVFPCPLTTGFDLVVLDSVLGLVSFVPTDAVVPPGLGPYVGILAGGKRSSLPSRWPDKFPNSVEQARRYRASHPSLRPWRGSARTSATWRLLIEQHGFELVSFLRQQGFAAPHRPANQADQGRPRFGIWPTISPLDGRAGACHDSE